MFERAISLTFDYTLRTKDVSHDEWSGSIALQGATVLRLVLSNLEAVIVRVPSTNYHAEHS